MKNGVRSTNRIDEHNNFAYLAATLLLLLASVALSQELQLSAPLRSLVGIALAASLAASVWSVRGNRRWRWTRAALAVVVVVLLAIRLGMAKIGLDPVWIFAVLVYVVWTTWTAMKLVLFSGPVDGNKILGSFCIFLLLGIIWALLYLGLTLLRQEAFIGLPGGGLEATFSSLIYFSFVTLTTAGYGDIQPLAPMARYLAYLEAVIGQFYMAVLVASLVGSALSTHRR